ncbi:hypothetical protein ACHELK_003149 [Vibrio vulnificus]|uniref:hypothetical protein n=1 Tax=Vibrio parahaemolyticus TaxID=670 RepID=UPI00084AEDA0|nr:hypothetical protein [Vibrio parahaemolyticus]EIV1853394.1 hypothetical protein [Vibrio vulnificus]EJG0705468.1 hypothetical protein [Vibrio parahaemolyticus]ODW76654.1 hypothetical protein BBL92_14750 [Vibrio parahaemolyticus]
MKVLKGTTVNYYDLAIVGLGYESRAITTCNSVKDNLNSIIAVGYREHTSAYSYKSNYSFYQELNANIIEENDQELFKKLHSIINTDWANRQINCLLDITVMSRTRLATILMLLMENLKKGSTIRICYELAEYSSPSKEISPIRKIGPIIESLSGSMGDIELPSSIVLGLGYELGKAIGISNYLDTEQQYLLIPKSIDSRFEDDIYSNNKSLIESTSKNCIFEYDVCNPYVSYLNLRELLIAISEVSRPIVVPLGPKILSALCVILSKEMDYSLPIWRVSSEHNEVPVDRRSSGHMYELSLRI